MGPWRTLVWAGVALTAFAVIAAPLLRGIVMPVPARSSAEASSSEASICRNEAVPARTPTGRLRNTKHSTMMSPVPVSSNGGTLKAST